jgi:phosphate acetyltransferase
MSAQAAGEARPSKYDRLIAAAKAVPTVTTIVVHPCDESSLRGAADAAEAGIIKPILVGPKSKIASVGAKHTLHADWRRRRAVNAAA